MMQSTDFEKGLKRTLRTMGYVAATGVCYRKAAGVTTLIATQKGFGEQWFINVGFWIHDLGEVAPTKVEKTHIYCRLERLFPEFREEILTAGALDDLKQEERYEQLAARLKASIATSLRDLATLEGLREALKVGRLSHCLVSKEARAHLVGDPSASLKS